MDTKEIKRQIRALNKCKRQTRMKTPERRDINERIRDLKAQLTPVSKEVNAEKEKLIQEIIKKSPLYLQHTVIDYNQFSVEDLQKHLDKMTSKNKFRIVE